MGAYQVNAGPKPVHTKGSTSTTALTVMTSPIDGAKAQKARVHIKIDESSGDVEGRVVVQTSNDLVTWGSATTLTGYTTFTSTAGWTFGSTYATVTDAPYVRFAIEARNVAGTTKACMRCRLALDLMFS